MEIGDLEKKNKVQVNKDFSFKRSTDYWTAVHSYWNPYDAWRSAFYRRE